MNEYPQKPGMNQQIKELIGKTRGVLGGYFAGSLKLPLQWDELYTFAKFLYDRDESGSSDELVIKALEKAHSGGMNLHNDREKYLEGVMMLTSLHMKYGQYYRAINYFTEARDNGGNLPDAAYISYALALSYAYTRNALFNPSGFLGALSAVNLEDKETRYKAEAAVRRYLDQGTELILKDKQNPGDQAFRALSDTFTHLGFDALPEWARFVYLVENGELPQEPPETEEAPPGDMEPNASALTAREVDLPSGNQALLERLRQLEEENAALKRLLEEQAGTRVEIPPEPPMEVPIETEAPPSREYWVTGRRRRLLVFGDNRVPVDKLRRYANAIGFPADDIDFRLDYDRNAMFNLGNLQYRSPYIGILVGPNAHKIVNLGDHTSMIQKLRTEPGFPYMVEIRTHSGELKITKSSFEIALRKMMDHVEAISA